MPGVAAGLPSDVASPRLLSSRPGRGRLEALMLQRRPSITKPGGLEGEGFESGLLKMGIEGGVSLMS